MKRNTISTLPLCIAENAHTSLVQVERLGRRCHKKKKKKKEQDVALIPPRLDPIPFSNDLRIKLAEFARFNHHHHPGKRPPLAKFHLIGRACGN